MVFSIVDTISAGGSAAVLNETNQSVYSGIINRVQLCFPPGSIGNLRVALFDRDVQIFPFNRGSFLYGNNTLFDFSMHYKMPVGANELTILSYNTDPKYEHAFMCLVSIEPYGEITYQSQVLDKLTVLNESINMLAATILSKSGTAITEIAEQLAGGIE